MIKRSLVKSTMAAAIIALGLATVTTGCGCSRNVSVPDYVEQNPAVSDTLGESEELITSHIDEYGDVENTTSQEDTETQEAYVDKEYIKNTEEETKEAPETSMEYSTKKEEEEITAVVQKPVETTTETPTEKSTETTTETPVQKPTEEPTEKTTEKSSEAPTQKPTEAPTESITQAHTHSYTATVTKQPTCTAAGSKTFKCSCGDSYTEAIPATGHSYGTYTYNNDATEAADGTETATCSVCGAKDTRTAAGTKIAHVHNYTAVVTKAATCAEEGVKTYTCSCGSSYTEPISVIAHSFGDYIYNDDATTEKDGTKTATCSVCGKTDTITAEGTKKTLPSWYDEHSQTLNVATGGQRDGSLEAYYVSGEYSWSEEAQGCWDFGYSMTSDIVGRFAEGVVVHGYLYK